jgi:hypothetical protein
VLTFFTMSLVGSGPEISKGAGLSRLIFETGAADLNLQ